MFDYRIRICAAALTLVLSASFVAAQTSTTLPSKPAPITATQAAPAKDSAQVSTADEVKHWTEKQWDAAKLEWRKDKDKWDSCNKQSNDKHFAGKDNWSFIYTCMKS